MCGIAGIWSRHSARSAELAADVERMHRAIAHRGPDGHGVWTDSEAGIALAHRRLAIIELSEAGAQPMASASGRYVLSFNGEIYNFEALRKELVETGWPDRWRGGSDTEVLLAAVEQWGLESTLCRADGMFALALWDKQERRLTLARDRFGEKPLYYGFVGGRLLFGSELRALAAAAPAGLGHFSPEALDYLVRRLCIPAPLSVYRGIAKLPAGQWICIDRHHIERSDLPEARPYWDAVAVAAEAYGRPFQGSEEQAVERLSELLEQSVRRRLVADVPVGAMLSGGIDSSVVCALAQSTMGQRLRTFTIGFHDTAYDEAPHAAAVAEVLGTRHTTLRIGEEEVRSAVPEMAHIYDEPFADSSQINMTILSRALRREVTVALSGDGGDELFGGYVRYLKAPGIWATLERVPLSMRRVAAGALRGIGPARASSYLCAISGLRGEQAGRVEKALGLLESPSEADLYNRLLSVWPGGAGAGRSGRRELPGAAQLSFSRRMMLADTKGYLESDVLTKVDRAAMSTALETRLPFLQPEIFAFAWSLPDPFLIRNGRGKVLLRRVAERFIPAKLLDRPKQGFAIPLGAWLRGPLRGWAEHLIEKEQLSSFGVLDRSLIAASWQAHCVGKSDESARLWPILMFEAWREAQRDTRVAEAA